MRVFSTALAMSVVVSIGGLALLLTIDRELDVPVPYAAAVVVATLNALAGLAIVLPRRTVMAPMGIARPRLTAPHRAQPTVAIDEAVIWFEPNVATVDEEAA